MTTLSFRQFGGEIPRLPADRLPDGAAQYARNVDTAHGELRALKGLGSLFMSAVQPVRTVFTDDGVRFYTWDKPTRAFLAPTIDDTAGRLYYQKHGEALRVTLTSGMKAMNLSPSEPTTSWKVGVKPPPAPSVTLGAATGGEIETVAVVAVAVNAWGEESAPSAPTLFEKQIGQSATYSVSHSPDAAQQTLQGIAFYRTYPANSSTDYLLANASPAALSGGVASFADASTAPVTTTALASAEWDPPPAALANLTYVGNGFFAASAGKDLLFSEPYRPHAWPYRMTLPHGIVGIVAVEGGALVTTTAQAWLVAGAHPSQMSQQLLPVEQAGWSDTALARIEGAAVYASNDGLVSVHGGQPSLKESQQLFTRKDWRSRYGSARLNLRLAHHDGQVLGLVDPAYPISRGEESFLLRLDESAGSFCRLDAGEAIYGVAVSATTDQLYVGTAAGFAEFGVGTALTYVWHSAERMHPQPVNFAAATIDCDGAVTVEVFADGLARHSQPVTGRTAFRLPPGPAAYRWAVRLAGTATVREVSLAGSFAELKGV